MMRLHKELLVAIEDVQGHLGICPQCDRGAFCSEGSTLMMQLLILRSAWWERVQRLMLWGAAATLGVTAAAAAVTYFFL